MEIQRKTYDELAKIVIAHFNKFEHGELIKWCQKNGISHLEVYKFRNHKLKTNRPYFLKKILEALGYTNITITRVTYFDYTISTYH